MRVGAGQAGPTGLGGRQSGVASPRSRETCPARLRLSGNLRGVRIGAGANARGAGERRGGGKGPATVAEVVSNRPASGARLSPPADIFPLLGDAELAELAQDIKDKAC